MNPLYRTTCPTPFGTLALIASDRGLRAVLWPHDRAGRVTIDEPVEDAPAHPVLQAAARQLDEYVAGERRSFDVPLDPRGTDLQQRTWAQLARIPFGRTRSYAEHAAAVGRPEAVRAVAAAIGRNPLSIVLPCHRVVGSDGRLTGFAGGLDVKRRLLDHEAAALAAT